MTREKFSDSTIHFVDQSAAERMQQSARANGFTIAVIDASLIGSESDLLKNIAAALSFPPYFGENWNALEECLRDLTWLDTEGVFLIFQNADHLLGLPETDLKVLMEVLEDVGKKWASERQPFQAVFLGGVQVRNWYAGLASGPKQAP